MEPGEAYLAETPVLLGHAGTQPDLFLRWNTIPPDTAAIDVVVHLHGFSQQRGDMALAEKVPRSGLDLAGRGRPTLAVLPRGNWLGRTWYDFPALLDGGLDRLIDYAVAKFLAKNGPLTLPSPPVGERVAEGWRGKAEPYPKLGEGEASGHFAVDRLIVTAHSGGVMPAVDALAGMRRPPDELHLFDGLYGRDPALGEPLGGLGSIEAWLDRRIAQEPQRPGALRVIYIERQTGPFSRAVGKLIEPRLRAAPAGLAPVLAPRYRVEPSGVPHGYVASVCGPVLLSDPGADFDWARIV